MQPLVTYGLLFLFAYIPYLYFQTVWNSAYRPGHSVETTLLNFYSSILSHWIVENPVSLIYLIYLRPLIPSVLPSVILDSYLCYNHLLASWDRHWIKSYIAGRSFKIKAGSSFSSIMHWNIGVPQGSVLGPLLFNCVMPRLPPILESMGVQCHLYAEYTHFLITFDRDEESSARDKVLLAFEEIKRFMAHDVLKLNSDKTVFIPLSRSTSEFLPWQLDSYVSLCPSNSTPNFGLILDRLTVF